MSLATWCTLMLSVLSLCQVSYAIYGGSCSTADQCNTTSANVPNYNCPNGVCECAAGYTNHSTECRKSAHGEGCSPNECESGLTCQSSKCSCNLTSEYWNNGCFLLGDIKITLSNNLTELNRITLNWTVTTTGATNLTGFTYSIMNGTDITSAANTGGSITGLTSGTRYNFNIVAKPPVYSSITYKNVSVAIGDIWTKSTHGENCGPAECDTDLKCHSNKCTCDPNTEYWNNGCYLLGDIKITLSNNLTELNRITLNWTVTTTGATNLTGFTYSIMNGTDITSAANTGGSITGLTSGTRYNFNIVAKPPVYSSITYKNVSVAIGDIWTKSTHGENCGPAECDTDLECHSNKCTCDPNTEYWNNGCYLLAGIQVNIKKNVTETNKISLDWTVTATNSASLTGFTYSIMNGAVLTSAANTGGSISGLTSGTSYKFTIVATPPVYSSITYKNVSVAIGDIWTRADYSEVCTTDGTRACDSGLTCRLDKFNASRCLCNELQYWSNGCLNIDTIKVTNIKSDAKTDTVTFTWTASGEKITYSIFNGSTSVRATASGGNVTGLTAGTKYNFAIVSTPPVDPLITYNSVDVPTGDVWTKPNPPGQVFNVTLVQNSSDTYDITFGASNGNVNKYFIIIDGKTISSQTSSTTIQVKGLEAGKSYSYSLYAENGNGDKSAFVIRTLSTSATESGPVSNVNITDVTNTSATINWHNPSSPNGIISGYIIQLQLNNSCWHVYRINAPSINVSNCQNYTDVKNFTDVKNLTELNFTELNFTIEKLKPYRNYTVLIAAVNEVGKGIDSPQQFQTKVGTPYKVTNVHVDNSTTNKETSVGLYVTWTPGESTGPTSYNVCLADSTTSNCNVTDKNNIEFLNLLGYWTYTITVQASTVAGVSEITAPEPATTFAKIPGLATFTLIQDPANATKLSIVLTCPEEKSRNGKITKYIINILNLSTSASENQTETPNLNCGNKMVDLNNIKAEYSYNISVQVQNHVYSGSFSPAETKFVESRAPILPSRTLTKGSSQTTSTVKVDLCVTCILDDTQGKVIDAGLIVCLDVSNSQCYSEQGRKKRSTTYTAPQGYDQTWSKSQSAKFVMKYRTTPENWLTTLKGSQFTYPIGNDNCNSQSNNYCNGPLPSNTKMKVSIVVCTARNCTEVFIDGLRTEAEPDNTGAIVGGVVGGILGLAVIVAVVYLIIYFKRRPKRSRPSSQYLDMDKRAEFIEEHRPIKITDFKNHVKSLHKDSNLKFQDEFEDVKKLSARFPHTSDEAKKESNRVKNRYVDILPYDHSRVKLEVQPEDDETMDFINANYIAGYSSVREYIATQGPMHSTVPDFWRMVWEQKSRVIVMLSDLTEQGKPKVTLYWPENLGEPINYGNVIVEMTNFSQLNKYIIRNFRIAKGSETRKVTHFFLPGWWDFSANLTTSDVLEFAQLVRQEATPANSGPLIVHCSAGVGRTGTFIALDYFMQYVEKHSLFENVDVFGYVMKMRNNRPRMVQAETQYIFIFDALDEVIDRKIKLEQEKTEHVYNNGGSDLYANFPKAQEENVYANTQLISEKNGIDNKAFESDYENLTLNNEKSNSPTTVL